MESDRLTTIVSVDDKVTLPKELCEKRRWKAGTKLVVKETPAGILSREVSPFAPTRPVLSRNDVDGARLG
jgi:bifunctional DNA-binding transcriptional regulator/antitoxin component of YhaV-PrlF toxin-antitoxin module